MEKPVESLLRGGQFKQFIECEFASIRQQYDLSRIEIEVLYFLSKCKEKNTLADIHRYLNANKGHISQTVDKLCKKGYLLGEHDKNDRRYMHYTLTDSATELKEQIVAVWNNLFTELFAGIDKEDLEVYKKVSGQIGENMRRLLDS